VAQGITLAGSWGLFDNFHNIDVQVLSVAAQLIDNLLLAKKQQKRLLDLSAEPGTSSECGVFCTQVRHTHRDTL